MNLSRRRDTSFYVFISSKIVIYILIASLYQEKYGPLIVSLQVSSSLTSSQIIKVLTRILIISSITTTRSKSRLTSQQDRFSRLTLASLQYYTLDYRVSSLIKTAIARYAQALTLSYLLFPITFYIGSSILLS